MPICGIAVDAVIRLSGSPLGLYPAMPIGLGFGGFELPACATAGYLQ